MLRKFFRNKWVKRIFIFHVVLLLILVALFLYVRHVTIDNYEKSLSNTPYDAIIVPGVPFDGHNWQDIMKARVYWSKYLFEKGYAKNIIYPGSAVYTPYVESKIMKTYAVAMGLPENRLFAETQAEHSTENLYNSYQIARQRGFQRVALATDPFQSFFLMRFARNQKLKVDFIPIQFDILKKQELIDPIIDPSSAFVPNFVALPERQGFFERFKGTLGHHIKDPSD